MPRSALSGLLLIAALFIGNVCPGAVALVDYFDLQSYGTVAGGQTITDALGNAQATLNPDANTSLTSSGLTISGGNSRTTGLNLAAGALNGFTGSFTIQTWVTVQGGGGVVLYAANNGPANGYIATGYDGYAAVYGFKWGSCLSGGGAGNATGIAYNRYGQTAGLAYSMTAGTLYDIVLTYDAGTHIFRQYVNGALTGSQTNDFSQNSLAQAQNFTVGGGTATQTWGDNSALSTTKSFLLYRGALSASEVTNIHNLGVGASVAAIQSQLPADKTFVWNGAGADNHWSTVENWTATNAPAYDDVVIFAGNTQTTVNLDAGSYVGSLTFSNNAGSYNLTNAANTLGLNGGLTNNSASAQTINVPVTLSTTQPINAAVGNLIFGQNINNNGNTVTFAGSGDITLNGMLTGSGGVVQTGTGTLTISLPFNPPASYSGNTVIQSGALQLLNDSFRLVTSPFSGAGNLVVSTNGGVVGPMVLWGANNLTGTTTVSNGSLFVAYAPSQSIGSTISVRDGATFGVLARADTNYVSPNHLIIGSSTGATLQFGMTGISEPGLTGTNHAPIEAGTVTIHGTATINIANCPFATNSYPLFTGYSSGNLALGSQPLGYSGQLTVIGSTVFYTVTNLDSHYGPFVHPGCMSTQADIDRMKAKIAAGAEPWASAYAVLTNNGHSSASYTANPIAYPSRGVNDNYAPMMNDAAAAYECALRYRLTGDTNFAECAMRNMDSYAKTVVQIRGNSNALLLMGAQGFDFACAAELLRDYQPWVDSGGFARFQNFLVYRFYTDAFNGNGIYWFLMAHNGTCWSHYWLNWDGFALSAAAAIGVVCDRRDIYDFAVNYYKGSGAGNGMVTNAVYFMHPGYLGQSQEMGRDMGHASLDPVLLAELCEVAWNQGDDLFGYDNNAVLAMSEYTCRAMTTNGVPWVNYAGCDATATGPAVGSNYRAGLDMIWNHYLNIKGLSAPYTMASALANRPEGGGGNYGGNSGGFDQIGFTTLTHALDRITNSPAPSALQADAPLAGTARVWWYGSAYATGYNVKRATSVDGPYTVIAANQSATDFLYTDTNLTPDTAYYYVVSAIINGVETTNSLPVSVTANQRLTGTVIGTDSVFVNGQWKDQLFDNAPITWFDCSAPSGGWAGLDLGASYRITKVGYYPRANFPDRMTGGRFQGCNVADFSSGVVTLCTIGSTPAPGTTTVQTVTNTGGYRYVRYIGPPNGYCNTAELQFEGMPAPAAAQVPPMLQAYLKFDETSGTTAADATGNGWDGTLVNSPTRVAGYSNNAVNLSSNSFQYVTLPGGVVSNLDAVSIAAWVKLTSSSTWSRIFDFGTGQSVYMFLTPRNGTTNNAIRFAITTSGGAGEQIIDGASELPTGVWKHVAVTIGGNGGVLYVDGVPVGTNSAMTLVPSFLGTTTQNYIGKSQYNDPYLNGQVDDFRIYNGALSAADVATFVTPLAAPTGLAAMPGDGQIVLSWNGVTSASSYSLLRSLTNGGPYTQITNVTATTFTDTALANGVMYYYVVRAANVVGESPSSIQVSARPTSAARLTSSATLTGNQLQLSWPADHTGWRLQVSTNLNTTNWQDIAGTEATNAVSLLPTNGNAFFRLIYP
ncbi:MAG TPA: LamG-like jellyroll fold domain-containing protein [Verrucomicrobiae bacterium]|nr:LamG-like jellyroll fold domain-containing protein [Verrucomicrobiae bacterium]